MPSEGLVSSIAKGSPRQPLVGLEQTPRHPGPSSLHREEPTGPPGSVMNGEVGSLKGQIIPKSPVAPVIYQAKLDTEMLL